MEIYVAVGGYEGLYEVSNYGTIRNAKTGKVKQYHQKRNADSWGPHRVTLSKKSKVINYKVIEVMKLGLWQNQ